MKGGWLLTIEKSKKANAHFLRNRVVLYGCSNHNSHNQQASKSNSTAVASSK